MATPEGSDPEWDKVKQWSEKVLKSKEDGKKKTTSKLSTLKHIALIVIIVLVALGLVWFLYRAYTVPDPVSLTQEIDEMIKSNLENHKQYHDRRHQSSVGAGLYT
jgi:hypothetical protein